MTACEARIPFVCQGWPASGTHHRQKRSPGHVREDVPENRVAACVLCHDWIEKHPQAAHDLGLIVWSWEPLGAIEGEPALSPAREAGGSAAADRVDGAPCPHPTLAEGERCSCGYRKPHAKKDTSPKTSSPIAFKVPQDALSDFREIEEAVFVHLGVVKDGKAEPFARHKAILTGYAAILKFLEPEERAA